MCVAHLNEFKKKKELLDFLLFVNGGDADTDI